MSLTRSVFVVAAAALCTALVGCAGQTASRSSAPTAATPTSTRAPSPSPSPSPSVGCTATLVLAQVHQLLAGQDFEAHYLTIGDRFTLSVWIVDPEIDPATPKSGMAAADRRAMERGLSLSYQLVDQIPCTRWVFDQVNPMIVDGHFQHWYKDFLPVGAFVGLHDPTTDQLIAAVEATGNALEEPRAAMPQTPPAPAPAAASGSCGWPEARAAIHANLGAGANSAAYLIIGAHLLDQANTTPNRPDDVGVEVQWPVLDPKESTDPVVLERMGHLAQSLACLSPAIDSLEVFVVDSAGRTLVYGVVPGSIIRTGVTRLPLDGVRIYHMRPAPLP